MGALVVVVQLGQGVLLKFLVKPLELGLGLIPLQALHVGANGVIGLGLKEIYELIIEKSQHQMCFAIIYWDAGLCWGPGILNKYQYN